MSICVTFTACVCCSPVRGQQNTQAWFDFIVDYPFSNQYLAELETSYQAMLTGDSTWRSYNLTPTLEYQFFPNVDFIASVPLAYTVQTEGYESFESRITLEVRWHITQNKRVNTRLVFKGEERFFQNLETNDWENSTRVRLMAEASIAINGPNLYKDKLWYAIADYEQFFVTDKDLDERYANRRRGRLGAGYRLNYKNRFELVYTLQASRNEIYDSFESTDNVLQLRYKMFLNPARPSATNEKKQTKVL
jgi:hypothetical protein